VTQRSTRQRRAIRAVFEKLNRPLSPQEVLAAVGEEVEGIGIATVYRAVSALLEEGFLTKVDVPGEPARYELSGKGHHHHFQCQSCGTVFELARCSGNFKEWAPPGFSVTGHEVWIYGSCSTCRKASPRG
jgi:Fur family ferric uptake transcriptional regulator